MIKVYINNEFVLRFDNEYQLDNWYQTQDTNFGLENYIEIEYENDEEEE